MKNDGTLYGKQKSMRQLLLQFVLSDGSASEHQSVKRVIEAVRELGLHPTEVERITKAVMEALQKATRPKSQVQHNVPVTIRVWISGADAKNRQHSRPDLEPGDRQECCGWGFFLIQREEDHPQVSTGGSHHVVELYLYQAREDSQGRP